MVEMRTSTARDKALLERARKVVPGGVYGHQSTGRLPDEFPQFFTRGRGSRVWDVDNNEYIDFMCSYGPVVLGHYDERVEQAVAAQLSNSDCFNGPTERWVELAELLVEVTPHADWAWFAKNGTDATTYAVSVARAHTGKKQLLRAQGAYHGASPAWTPRPAGVTPEDTANQISYVYNDLASVHDAIDQAGGDLAAIITSPFRHDAWFDQEDVDPEFALGLRHLCDETGAVLILDDVRAGFRISLGGSWEPLGIKPDIAAYCKAIANGYPISAVVATEELRDAASSVYATGSYWFSGGPMAAAIATIETLRDTDALKRIELAGRLLRDGLAEQAESYNLRIRQTGPVQVPFMSFEADENFERGNLFSSEAVKRGAYLHPWHNWFLSAAHTEQDIKETLEITDIAFQKVREVYGEG